MSGTVTAGNGIIFTADGYTLSGGTINLAGATPAINTISVSTGTAAIASPLTGTNGLTKAGNGTLLLTGDNSGLSGGIVLANGTLAIGAANALGTPGANALTLNKGTITSSDTTPTSSRAPSPSAATWPWARRHGQPGIQRHDGLRLRQSHAHWSAPESP